MRAAKEGIWPEFWVHGVRADFMFRHSSPLTPVEILDFYKKTPVTLDIVNV